uniref:peptidylamidoglycolate lyase n=1 Tax=Elaeophora elaphi TaxID=1147741 RepID=A0A158Q8J5_9BILA
MTAIRNYYSFGGYYLLVVTLALTIGQTIQQSDFDYNYKSIYGENGQVDNDDDDGNIIDDDNRIFAPLDNANDKAYILPISKPIGQITGLGINSKGYLLAFHRADRIWNQWSFDKYNNFNASLGPIKNATIYAIDPISGKIMAEYGKDAFYMPHGLTIDCHDNIWVTDVGSHQVFKYDKNFKLLMKLGEHLKPGSDKRHFCKPTDVAVARNGHFFVADGYCNSRIMKFDQNGKLLAEIGHFNGFGEAVNNQFSIPHSIALIEDLNLICVADRENERIQCFSAGIADEQRALPTGMLITKAESVGRIYAIREKSNRLNYFGIENAHCLAISDDGIVYVGQTGPKQIVQISLLDQ